MVAIWLGKLIENRKQANKQGYKMSDEDLEKDDSKSSGYTGDDYDGRDTYMQGDIDERDVSNSSESHTCQVCGFEQGQHLEDFENSEDFELTDDCGRTIEVDEDFRICEECYEASHDTHWHAMHPEY